MDERQARLPASGGGQALRRSIAAAAPPPPTTADAAAGTAAPRAHLALKDLNHVSKVCARALGRGGQQAAPCRPSSTDHPAPGALHRPLVAPSSQVCANLEASVAFYRDLLGFLVVQRPSSLSHSNIEGCWLWRYGLGLHLIQGTPPARPAQIIPTSDHLSFTVGRCGCCACLPGPAGFRARCGG